MYVSSIDYSRYLWYVVFTLDWVKASFTFVYFSCWRMVGDAGEHEAQIRFRIDAVESCGAKRL